MNGETAEARMSQDPQSPPTESSVAAGISPAARRPDESPEVGAGFGLTARDCRFLMFLSTILLVMMGIHLLRFTWLGEPALRLERADAHRFELQIDVNQATWVEWMQLPEIGEGLARKIVKFREEQGPFLSTDDVRRVPGIGPATLEQIRPYLKWTQLPAIGDTERPLEVGNAGSGR
jgi:competence ComEA-like helix-hairpin-helix protein